MMLAACGGGSSAPAPVVVNPQPPPAGFADMNGIFLAYRPRLPQGIIVNAASVLDVYPLMLEILEFPLAAPIDGDVDALAGLLTE